MNALTKTELQEIAKRIRSRTAQALIENGHDLLKAKAALPHGKFIAWLKHDVQITPRSAQRAMQVAEWVDTLDEVKYDTVSRLPRKHLYLLSAPNTPPGARERAFHSLLSPMQTPGRCRRPPRRRFPLPLRRWPMRISMMS